MEKKIYLNDFLEKIREIGLEVRLVAGAKGLDKEIKVGDINRPGLTLSGFFDFFAHERFQIFGLGEFAFMMSFTEEEKREKYRKFFSYDVLCCIFTHDEMPDALFMEYADQSGTPVFVTDSHTTSFTTSLIHILDDLFAPSITLHATLVDVFGIGVLLFGKSGVGKSECALELIERGHRLVADDMVTIKKTGESLLMGNSSPMLQHHMEIRGLGIINVREIFGIRSVRNDKRIDIVVLLEEWDSKKEYDRLGLEERNYTILDVEVPYIIIPVRPGRNIPVLIETASLNQRLKKHGIFSAIEFDKRIQNWVQFEGPGKK